MSAVIDLATRAPLAPTALFGKVMPRKPRNSAVRTREHLTADEVEKLIEAAKANRHGLFVASTNGT